MEYSVNKGVRKANYERGLKFGEKVYCGQDLRDLIGMKIVEVDSNDIDSDVVMWLEDEERHVAIFFGELCFDGENMSTVEFGSENGSVLLKEVTEEDLKEFATMTLYYENDIVGKNDEKTGVRHIYCNDISLEGTDDFTVKSLYVFYDGRIMTEK